MIRFAAPEYLLLMVLLVWFWRMGTRRSPGAAFPWDPHLRRTVVRCVAAALLILAASRLQVRSGEESLSVMLVVDISESMAAANAAVQRRLDALVTRLRPDDRVGVVVFGASPTLERALAAPAAISARASADLPAIETDIESALRFARSSLPPAGLRRIVLMSDGRQTRGDVMREAAIAASSGIAVDVAPAATAPRTRAVVRRLSAPPAVKTGESFPLMAIAEGPAGARGEIVIESDRGLEVRRDIRFSDRGDADLTQIVREAAPGAYVYRAGVRLAEPDPLDIEPLPSAGAVVTVFGGTRVLYVRSAGAPLPVVSPARFTIDRVAPAGLSPSAPALAVYDVIVLDDVGQDELTPAQLSALSEHVEHRAGGLIMLGSARSLDTTVLPDRGLGALLPVDFRPRAGARAPEVALVVVFDKSGSMEERASGAAKIEFAREGIRQVLETLPATDALGVIAFDSEPTDIAPLRVGHDPGAIGERLRQLQPGGSTAIAPALQRAREWLLAQNLVPPSRRHVLLVSDGRTRAADALQLQQIARLGGFQLSVIHLGDERDRPVLTAVATESGGRAYFPEDAADLPRLVARETARVAGGLVVEEAFVPQLVPHPLAAGVSSTALPRLDGYVVGAPRPGAEIALRSHRGDPVLATWRFGLGKVAVYTADLHSSWSARLRASGLAAPLLGGTMDWVSRPASTDALYVSFDERGERVAVSVEVTDDGGGFISLLDASASIRMPSGEVERLALTESRPGRYEAGFSARDRGAYVLSLSARDSTGTFEAQVLRGFYQSADREQRSPGTDRVLLSRVAETTGGSFLDADSDPFSNRPPTYYGVDGWLLGAAFFVFLAELLAPGLGSAARRPADAERHAA